MLSARLELHICPLNSLNKIEKDVRKQTSRRARLSEALPKVFKDGCPAKNLKSITTQLPSEIPGVLEGASRKDFQDDPPLRHCQPFERTTARRAPKEFQRTIATTFTETSLVKPP
jgi:hypothetical protein